MGKRNKIIYRVYDHVENGDADKAVFACLRLSRSLNDVFNTLGFLKELDPDRTQYDQAFYDETKKFKKDAREKLWKTLSDRWIDSRTLQFE